MCSTNFRLQIKIWKTEQILAWYSFLQLLKSKSVPWLKVSHLHVSTNFYLLSEITFNNYCSPEIEKSTWNKTALGTLSHQKIGTVKWTINNSHEVSVSNAGYYDGWGPVLDARDKKGLLTFQMNYKVVY